MKTIQEIKKELNLTNEDLATIFGFGSVVAYANSSDKGRYEDAFVSIYHLIENKRNQ